MASEYNLLILKTDGFDPKSWSDNPERGRLVSWLGPIDLAEAQTGAKDFNEKALAAQSPLWGVVTPAKAIQYTEGQIIHVEKNYAFN